jgi:hypothetical protein
VQNAECGTESEPARVKVPLRLADWVPADFDGLVTLERAFGLPTNLDEDHHVALVVQTQAATIADARLNKQPLPVLPGRSADLPSQRWFDARGLLQTRNRLSLTLAVTAQSQLVEVKLELAPTSTSC